MLWCWYICLNVAILSLEEVTKVFVRQTALSELRLSFFLQYAYELAQPELPNSWLEKYFEQ